MTAHGPTFAGPLLQEDSLVVEIERVAGEAVHRLVTLERVEGP